MGMLIVAVVLGSVLTIASTLAMWLAFGKSAAMWRAILTELGASVAGLMICAASGELELEWLGLLWVVVVVTAGMFLFLRWLGVRLVDTRNDNDAQSRELQFSVKQLMELTAVVAGIATVARFLAPPVATMDFLVFGTAIAVCVAVVALVAAWAIIYLEINRVRLATLAATSIGIAALVYYGMESTKADPGFVWAMVTIMYSFGLVAAMLVARSRGIRLLSARDGAVARNATETKHALERPIQAD